MSCVDIGLHIIQGLNALGYVLAGRFPPLNLRLPAFGLGYFLPIVHMVIP